MRAALIACLLAVAASIGGLNAIVAGTGASAPEPADAQRVAAERDVVAFERARSAARRAERRLPAGRVLVRAEGDGDGVAGRAPVQRS